MKTILLVLQLALFSNAFDLKPTKLSQNSYYFYGKEEYFTEKNKGDIANASFIITENSVILIDTGSSKLYGEEIKKHIEKITSKPLKYIIITHHHPDHFLGNAAFTNSDIFASNFTKEEIEKNGYLYIANLRNLTKSAMVGTNIKAPNKILKSEDLVLDNYKLKILYLDGHTSSDVAIYDENTKILYASDLVFYKRTPATPHANIKNWIESLEKLKKIDYSTIVPGHGIASNTKDPINENIAYLKYLDSTLKDSIKNGLDVFEILEKPIPEKFQDFTMFKEEFERSIINLYPSYEKDLR